MTDRPGLGQSFSPSEAAPLAQRLAAELLEENVPEELRRRPQWVVRKGKILHDARTGGRASSTDSETWGTFAEAVGAFGASAGGYDGVGFVFSSGDPYAGVDLDKCRDPETGELEEWAEEVVDALGGYAEVSPSGTGVHVIVRGKAPNRKRGATEAYSSERYFTVTGDALEGASSGAPAKLPERQAELDELAREYLKPPEAPPGEAPAGEDPGGAPRTGPGSGGFAAASLSDGEVIGLCRQAGNAWKFSMLYDEGDTSLYPSPSEADEGLLGVMKFYTRDPGQLERLFDGSALGKREKWRSRPRYRRDTIGKAIADAGETYTPPRSRSRSLGSTGMGNETQDALKQSVQALSFRGREEPPRVAG